MTVKIGNVGITCAVLTFFAVILRIILEFARVIPCGCQNIFYCQTDPNCELLNFNFSI
jgi:hypothetical protein